MAQDEDAMKQPESNVNEVFPPTPELAASTRPASASIESIHQLIRNTHRAYEHLTDNSLDNSRGFGRQSNKGNQQQNKNGQQSPSPTSYSPNSSLAPSVPAVPQSPSLSSSLSADTQAASDGSSTRKPAFFFREEYSNLIVKGNFMTLAAKPILVEEGEWLAHQVVEQYRLLEQMIDIIKLSDERTGIPICNPSVCPTMSASGHTYTWLDQQKKPIKIPAIQYMNLVQKWIIGKISDPNIFPTETSNYSSTSAPSGAAAAGSGQNRVAPADNGREWLGKSSGFPESIEGDIKSIYRQMMRCYAHLYHGHWLDPFWHIGAYKELNTCFIHFINVGKLFGLLGDKETEPMQPLIDLWLMKGLLPQAPAATTSSAAASAAPAAVPTASPVTPAPA